MSKYIVFDKHLAAQCEYEEGYEVAKSIIEVLDEEIVELTSTEINLLSKEGYAVVRLTNRRTVKSILNDIREKERKKKEKAEKLKQAREEKKLLKLAQEKKLKEEQERKLLEDLKKKYND